VFTKPKKATFLSLRINKVERVNGACRCEASGPKRGVLPGTALSSLVTSRLPIREGARESSGRLAEVLDHLDRVHPVPAQMALLRYRPHDPRILHQGQDPGLCARDAFRQVLQQERGPLSGEVVDVAGNHPHEHLLRSSVVDRLL